MATDVDTLSPLHDPSGMSGFLAATCVMECIHLVYRAIEARERDLTRSAVRSPGLPKIPMTGNVPIGGRKQP